MLVLARAAAAVVVAAGAAAAAVVVAAGAAWTKSGSSDIIAVTGQPVGAALSTICR